MSRRKDKEAKRKAKLKAKKGVAEQNRLLLSKRIADAIMDLCADVLPEYVDDSKGFDLAGRVSLWRLGMTAWNIAVSGRKEIEKSSIDAMRLDDQSRKTLQDEINGFVRRKYEKYPGLRTKVSNVAGLFIAGEARRIQPDGAASGGEGCGVARQTGDRNEIGGDKISDGGNRK